jgi:hypothetical protein
VCVCVCVFVCSIHVSVFVCSIHVCMCLCLCMLTYAGVCYGRMAGCSRRLCAMVTSTQAPTTASRGLCETQRGVQACETRRIRLDSISDTIRFRLDSISDNIRLTRLAHVESKA